MNCESRKVHMSVKQRSMLSYPTKYGRKFVNLAVDVGISLPVRLIVVPFYYRAFLVAVSLLDIRFDEPKSSSSVDGDLLSSFHRSGSVAREPHSKSTADSLSRSSCVVVFLFLHAENECRVFFINGRSETSRDV